MLLPIFHLCVIVINSFTLWYDQKYGKLLVNDSLKVQVNDLPLKARFLFLTIWCLVVQTLYFTLALLNDLIGSNAKGPKKAPFIRKLKDSIFSLAFPLAIIVGLAFWSVYAYNKELILPDRVREHFPDWMNHVMHSTIVPFVLIELIITPISYPSRKIGISLGFLFIAGYVGLLAFIYAKTGSLVYPFLDVMSVPLKIAFVGGTSVVGIIVYFIGEALNKLFNPAPKDGAKKSGNKTNTKKQKKRV